MSDFQAAASEQGRDFEQAARTLLRIEGWSIIAEHALVAGQEVDIIATDPAGAMWWIECKGSWRGGRQGLRRTDTLKKAVAVAWYVSTLPDRLPFMLFVSHTPRPGSSGDLMLTAALKAAIITEVRAVSPA